MQPKPEQKIHIKVDNKREFEQYKRKGNWRCEKSPTMAHYSIDGKCQHCGAQRS